MKILTLRLDNFRGIKELNIDFAGKNTDISGENGSGKTTIANAIVWLLTGQAITGEKDFSPKTTDTHNLHHKVEMSIQNDDGAIIKLSKDFYEKWTKKKGSKTAELTGHTTDYAINDVPLKEKDFKTKLEAMVGPADVAKMLLVVGYFAEDMNQDERRRVLVEVCGDIGDEEILKNPKIKGLKEMLKIPGTEDQLAEYYTVDEYKAIMTRQRSKVKKDLEAIPIRIDELSKAIGGDSEDEATIKAELEKLREDKAELLDNNQGPKHALTAAQSDYLLHKQEYDNWVNEQRKATNDQMNELKTKRVDIEIAIKTDENAVETMRKRRAKLLEEWNEVVSKGQWTEDNNVCPYCKQPYPADQIAEKKAELAKATADKKASIRAEGLECSEDLIKEVLERINTQKAELDGIKEQMKALEGHPIPPFNETEEGIKLADVVQAMQSEVDKAYPDPFIQGIDEKIAAAEERHAKALQAKANQARIEELEEAQHERAVMLEQAEKAIFLCEEFVRLKVAAITDNINGKFHNISWLLFKEQINGGLKECCEPLIPSANGLMVEYKSANTAAKVNAGVEIINVLSKHYEKNMPVIVDQAESVCNIPETDSQLIRLIVSADDKKLKVINK